MQGLEENTRRWDGIIEGTCRREECNIGAEMRTRGIKLGNHEGMATTVASNHHCGLSFMIARLKRGLSL